MLFDNIFGKVIIEQTPFIVNAFLENILKEGGRMIYENIKELCTKRGISIAQLERQAGLGNGTIGKWREATPGVDKLNSVAKELKVSVKTLMK